MLLNEEQKKSQISDSHRLIQLTNKLRHKLDTNDGYGRHYELVDSMYFFNEIVAKLEDKLNVSVARRQSALLKRIKTKTSGYDGDKLTSIEYAAEVLFDSYFFKNNDEYVNRTETVRLIKESITKYKKIILLMPIMSRKPFSPIKNKGIFPDLGEINTLLRCAKVAKIISNTSGFPCEFLVLADGNKYNKACKTPHEVVRLYQQSLEYWVNYLNVSEYVKIKDYETWIGNEEGDWKFKRDKLYEITYIDISKNYDKVFTPTNLNSIYDTLKNDTIGEQLAYTFWSIITSVNYTSLYPEWIHGNQIYTRENQNFYISFISSLHYSLNKVSKSHLFFSDLVGDMSYSAHDRVMNMRHEAWEAAKRYVAISLTDRQLNTIFQKIPTAIKLTIHAKTGEYNFISTNQKCYGMTAQHTVSGIKDNNESLVVDYKYRLVREAEHQSGVYIKPSTYIGDSFDPLYEMSLIKQPVYYISK